MKSENYNIIKFILIRVRKKLKLQHRVTENNKETVDAEMFLII